MELQLVCGSTYNWVIRYIAVILMHDTRNDKTKCIFVFNFRTQDTKAMGTER